MHSPLVTLVVAACAGLSGLLGSGSWISATRPPEQDSLVDDEPILRHAGWYARGAANHAVCGRLGQLQAPLDRPRILFDTIGSSLLPDLLAVLDFRV